MVLHVGPGELSRYGDSLRAGRNGDRIPLGGEILKRHFRKFMGLTQPPIQWVPSLCQG
jgi:hypothetical protein